VRILVTGGSGFVGRHLVGRLAANHEVYTLQRRAGAASAAGVRAVTLDLATLTPDDLAAAVDGRLDVIVHLAARLDNPFGVDYSLAELAPTNVVGTVRLLEAGSALGIRRLVHGSTGGVGSNPPAGGLMHEDDPPAPINPYGLTKHLAEQAVRSYAWPFERVSLRYFAPYGRDGSNPMFHHLLDSIDRGEPIEVGSGGGAELNPIYIEDAVAATIRAIDAADLPFVINVAGPEVVTIAQLARLIGAAVGREVLIRERPVPDLSWAADIERMSRHLGAPVIGVAEGVRRSFGT
jgi:nucleoside-diphosphate-sugar epimerase